MNQTDPDLSRRGIRARPVAIAIGAIASLSLFIWLFAKSPPLLMITVALVVAAGFDALGALRSLDIAKPRLRAPADAVAGSTVTYMLTLPELRAPIRIARPGSCSEGLYVDTTAPGLVTLPVPYRGVLRYLILDLTSRGPLGMFEAVRRVRVWLPTPLWSGPAPLEHRLRWPRLRAMRIGPSNVATVGDDLFRGVRAYVRGDARRSIHWPATAHHGQLMVKEREGTGVVALRIVVHLPSPGPAAEVTAGRASWLAEEALRRGWVVHLVTVEPDGSPPPPLPLVRPAGPPPLPPPWLGGVHTVAAPVLSIHDIRRRLASAGFGRPEPDRSWRGLTRIISPEGDTWA